MDASQLIPLIRDIGVSGAVLLVIVLRIEPKLETLNRSIERLTDAVQMHSIGARADRARHGLRGERE